MNTKLNCLSGLYFLIHAKQLLNYFTGFLFLPYHKALCTFVLIYPVSSFQRLCLGFEESFLCRSLPRTIRKKRNLRQANAK